ncbi:homoserine kinase [Methylocella silvestris]|uniref:Homoserine kinase n=1 Tax=Methylocella silvestris TaxID=199596 RepID=A0A2J7TD66_METSI|nr:homoserine kinase [Methylocella silvestris]PNG24700.1 homoserine kinase [Methylocella silvestris]
MAVYTEVSDADLAAFLEHYDLGRVRALKGIAEGVENSNFILSTETGVYILTLYEKRVEEGCLPFFLSLLDHLAARGLNCPQPVRMRSEGALGRLAGRPAAIVTFLEGVCRNRPGIEDCARLGAALARLHLGAADFEGSRANALSLEAWPKLFAPIAFRADEVKAGLAATISAELKFLQANWPRDLPRGIIHADLFPDNVLFLGDEISGLIDFYFACVDDLAYDLAICLNAWCFDPDGAFNVDKGAAMFGAYASLRPLSAAEAKAIPILARGAALRFGLTRLVDWFNVPPGALVNPKNPLEYFAKLQLLQTIGDVRELGVLP